MFHLDVNCLRVPGRSFDHERTPLLPLSTSQRPQRDAATWRTLARRAQRRALRDQAGVLALAGAGVIYARQFFSTWVVSPQWAVAGVALKSSAALANASVGRMALRQRPAADAATSARSAVPWHIAVPAALAGARLVACPMGEAPAMLACFVLHGLRESLPEAAWRSRAVAHGAALMGYLLVRELMFAHVALPQHIVNFDAPLPAGDDACNGQVEICAKPWCDTVFPATHNAGALPVPFSRIPAPFNQLGRFASNQDRTLEQQFNGGIRGFLLEYYRSGDGTLMGSHNVYWNFEPMVRTFARFRTLLASQPRELVVLKMSPQGDMGDMRELVDRALLQSGLSRYMRAERPRCGETVGELLDAGVQLIAFDRGFNETYYSARSVAEITCDALLPWRPGPNRVPVTLNAFSTYAFEPASDVVNSHLAQIFDRCRARLSDGAFVPTLLAVNHYETSLVVPLAHAINGNRTLQRSAPSQRAMLVGFAEDGAAASALVCVLGLALLSLVSRLAWWRPRGRFNAWA